MYAVHRARDGAVWAGTLSGGASRFKDGAFTTYDTANGLASNTVASILESADGTMWFATPNGVSALSRGGWRTLRHERRPAVERRQHALRGLRRQRVDRHGRRARGLSRGQVRRRPTLPAVLRASILGLAEDRSGWLWVTTADRVLRVNREALAHGALGDADVREYGVADGLLGARRREAASERGRGFPRAHLVRAEPRPVGGRPGRATGAPCRR